MLSLLETYMRFKHSNNYRAKVQKKKHICKLHIHFFMILYAI